MGQGASIKDLSDKEQAFRDYLVQIRTDLEKDKDQDTKALDDIIVNYYKQGGWKYDPLMQMANIEVQQVSTWSLDNISKMITSVKDAIFGASPAPSGVDVSKPASMAEKVVDVTNFSMLVLNKSFDAIQGILSTFATETSFQGKSITKVEIVAPGMVVFISIRSDVWKNHGFFNNDSIAQYLFIVKSYFSADQYESESGFNSIIAFEDIKASYRTRIEALSEKIADPATPFEALTQLNEQMTSLATMMAGVQTQIDNLHNKAIDAATSKANDAMQRRAQAA